MNRTVKAKIFTMTSKLYLPVILLTVFMFVVIGFHASKWNPVLSQDTMVYYYPRVVPINYGLEMDVFTEPFLVPSESVPPAAHEAKPVFVILLKLWHGIYHALDPNTIFP